MTSKHKTMIVIAVVAAVVLGVGGKMAYDQMAAGDEYNRIVRLANDGQHQQAAEDFEKLITWAPGGIAAEAKQQAAELYIILGEEPASSLSDSARYFQRANELQPGVLNAQQRQVVDTAERLRHMPAYVEPELPPITEEDGEEMLEEHIGIPAHRGEE